VPGAGWIELDPTNGQFGNQNLIRVAVSRDPAQAPPLAGAFRGDPNDFIDMTVSVDVHQTGEGPQRSANQNARAV